MATSPCLNGVEKKPWWLTSKKAVGKYVREARNMMGTQDSREIAGAVSLLDTALAVSPRLEIALELKARCLLQLRRFKDVADMLQDYIPSLKLSGEDSSASSSSSSSSSDNSSQQLSRERVKLLPSPPHSDDSYPSFKCFSVKELKKRVMGGIWKSCDKQGQWRYLVLGRACCHLGLLEDAMVLLQTGKRLATAAFRRESICWSDDSFSLSNLPVSVDTATAATMTTPTTPPRLIGEVESITQLLSQIKLLIRRRTAAMAALDAGLHSEAVRHFSKILDGRRVAPQGFLAECYMHRATAYRSLGRIAEAIADCNRTLALDPTCIQALDTRAMLLEAIRCFPDCLHDLEHLKLLYNTILRDRKLPGPAWKRQYVHYREIPGRLCALTTKIQGLKQRVASGETRNVDYYSLMGLRRGCSRSELERAHLLLSLRHKPDKAIQFMEKCEFADDRDLASVKDRARMSALLLHRLIQKGYNSVMASIMEEEAAEDQRKKAVTALQAAITLQQQQQAASEAESDTDSRRTIEGWSCESNGKNIAPTPTNPNPSPSVFQGVFCRDLAAVRNLLSQVGINRPLPLKYEALSC